MIRRAVATALLVVGTLAVVATPVHAASGSDKQLANAGVLVVSDFPAGWTESVRAQTSEAALDAAAARIASCKPFLAFSKANEKNPRVKSPDFEHQQENVTNSVSVYPTDAKATAAMRTFADARLPACLDKVYNSVFTQQLKGNKKVKSVKTSIAPVSVHVGDEAVAYQGTVDVGLTDGSTQTIGLGVVSSRVGRAVAGYSWTSDTDISTTLQPAIVKSVTRLQDAQSAS